MVDKFHGGKITDPILGRIRPRSWPAMRGTPQEIFLTPTTMSNENTPTPETDAMEWDDAMCDPRYTVESDFARTLERQRDGAFALIDYAGELLGVPKQEHKSAHGFAILQAIKDLVALKNSSTNK